LSDHVESVKITLSADTPEDTAMTASFHTYKAGLKHFGIELNLYQDYAANKTDQTLYGLVGSSTLFALSSKATHRTARTIPTHDQHAVVGRLQPDIGKSGRYPEDAGEIRARLRVHSGPKLKASLQLWRWDWRSETSRRRVRVST